MAVQPQEWAGRVVGLLHRILVVLLTAYYLLLVLVLVLLFNTCYLLFTTCYLLLTTYYLARTTSYILIVTQDKIDTDGSGVIDYSEFMAATMDKRRRRLPAWGGWGGGRVRTSELHK